jgi:hypothetical protein
MPLGSINGVVVLDIPLMNRILSAVLFCVKAVLGPNEEMYISR